MKVSILIAALLLTAQAAVAAPETVSVEGTFVASDTGRGLPRANVELWQRPWLITDPGGTLLASTKMDAKGKFRFVGPWHGNMRIFCYSPGTELIGGVNFKGAVHDLRVQGHRRIVITGR